MNLKTILILSVLAVAGLMGWKHLHPDIQKIRDEAGINTDAVVMLWTSECGDICLDQASQIEKRGIEIVSLDINDGATGGQLWKAAGGGNGPLPTFLLGKEVYRPSAATGLRSKLMSIYGESALTAREKKYFKKHFDTDGTSRAVLYTAVWCGYCKQLKADLDASHTPYIEIDAEKHNNPQELAEVMNIPGFPTVYYGYERLNGDVSDMASQIRTDLKK